MKHYKADSILFWWYVLRDNAKLNNKNYSLMLQIQDPQI